MSLKIEQLTEQVEMTKTAEEEAMEKLAETVNVLEQAQTLTLIGEDLCKFAEEANYEVLGAIGEDLFNIGSRMGAALTKTATDGNYALLDSLEIAEDLNKVACVIAEIADEAQDEEFNKLAEAVIEISNEMTNDANEVIAELEKEAGSSIRQFREAQAASAASGGKSTTSVEPMVSENRAAMPTKNYQEAVAKDKKDAAWTARKDAVKNTLSKYLGKDAWKATAAREYWNSLGGNFAGKLQTMLGTKAGLKALAPVVAAYGGSAAVAGGLGYAAYRRSKKK